MKTLRHIQFCLFALLAGAAFTACNEEDPIDPNADIPGLGGEETVQTETDRWLYENYVVPFNIDVEYKWDATDMMPSIDKQLVPVDEELVIPFMQVMYDVWFSPYEQTAGLDFVKEITPKKVVLVGSPEYEFGAIKLGQAEGGRKILLLNVNGLPRTSRNSSTPSSTSSRTFCTRRCSSTRTTKRSAPATTFPRAGRASRIRRRANWASSPPTPCRARTRISWR